MEPVKIQPNPKLGIELYSGGLGTQYSNYVINGIFDEYPNGYSYITQRPSFNTFEVAADATTTPSTQGRGVLYSEGDGTLYVVNGTEIFKGGYSTAITPATVGQGADTSVAEALLTSTTRVYTAELAGSKFFLAPDVNAGAGEGKYMPANPTTANVFYNMEFSDGEDTSVTQANDFTAFPPNNSLELAHGVAVLDNYLFVMDTMGTIWNSALGDGTDWSSALYFIQAEKEDDRGVYIDKHHDNIVALGRRTCEFFYDAGNSTGSPLAVRDDISYNIGCADGKSCWRNGDVLYFAGIDTSGEIAVYELANFKIKKISIPAITSILTSARSEDSIQIMGSGLSANNKTFYILTLYNVVAGNILPQVTYAYNTNTQSWTMWDSARSTVDKFPLVSWTITDDVRIGEGILSNGDLISIADNFVPQDGKGTVTYIADGYADVGYYVASGSTGDNITMTIRLGHNDFGNTLSKRMSSLRFVGDETSASQTLTVKWSDNTHGTFSAGRILDLSNQYNKLSGLGQFKRRDFELVYSGGEQIRFEGLECNVVGNKV